MSEADEQQAVAEYCDAHGILFFHVPNGGKRSKSEAVRLKKQGVKAGVPDLFFPIVRGKWHGLFVELKTEKGRLSKAQKEWIEALQAEGYCAAMARGADVAIQVIEAYLNDEIIDAR